MYRITIVMSVYNCENTLEESIDSLLVQTYRNFKIVICDDASSDNTWCLLQGYAKKNPNIILLKNETNIKLAASLNRCLAYADTEYIARMDGDDISLPIRLEKQIKFLDANKEFAIVSCPMIHFDESGDWGLGRVIAEP